MISSQKSSKKGDGSEIFIFVELLNTLGFELLVKV